MDIDQTHWWKSPKDGIFVFGSNYRGIHGAGAARFARDRCRAEWGVGEGRTGDSYALPTCSGPGTPLNLAEVYSAVQRFIDHAKANYTETFFLSKVGCGIAGFTDTQIAPMFWNAPDNVIVPPEWLIIIHEYTTSLL